MHRPNWTAWNAKQELQNDKFLPTVGFEPSTPSAYEANELPIAPRDWLKFNRVLPMLLTFFHVIDLETYFYGIVVI